MKLFVYAGIFFALLAFVYWYSERQYDLGVYETTAKYETSLRESQNANIEQANEHQKAINAAELARLSKEPEIEIRYERIEKEIIKYVTNDKSCNLTYGAARLLEQQAKAQQLQADIHPSIPESKKRSPSPVSQLETVETCGKWAKLYNKQGRQLDALISKLD